MDIPAFIPGQKCGCGGNITPRNGIFRCDICYSSYGRYVIKVEDILDSIHKILEELVRRADDSNEEWIDPMWPMPDDLGNLIDQFKKQGE